MARNLVLLNPAVATMPAMLGQLAAYDLGNGERWLFICHNVVDNGATWDISWAFIGGPWIYNRIIAEVTPTSTTYPPSPVVSLSAFFDGTYDIRAGVRQQNTNAGGAFHAFAVGGSAANAATELLTFQDPTIAIYQEITWPRFTITGGSAGVWCRSPSGVVARYAYRSIAIRPRTIETTVPAP